MQNPTIILLKAGLIATCLGLLAAPSGVLADALQDCREGQSMELQARGCREYFRALSYVKSKQYDLARSELDHAININPQLYQAYRNRASLERFYKQYQKAREDLEAAIDILQQYSSNPAVRNYIQSLQDQVEATDDFRLREEHWVEYLKAIQNDRDCQNWLALPYDLYRVNAAGSNKALPGNAEHLAQNAVPRPCDFSAQREEADNQLQKGPKDDPPRPKRPSRPIRAVVLVGMIVVIILFGSLVLFRGAR